MGIVLCQYPQRRHVFRKQGYARAKENDGWLLLLQQLCRPIKLLLKKADHRIGDRGYYSQHGFEPVGIAVLDGDALNLIQQVCCTAI